MEGCIFCDIVNGKSPAEIVTENDKLAAFYDISPKAPVHILIAPKKHIPSIIDMKDDDKELIGEMVLTAKKIATDKGLDENGYRLVFNVGEHSGQVVDHIHLHVLGGNKLGPIA